MKKKYDYGYIGFNLILAALNMFAYIKFKEITALIFCSVFLVFCKIELSEIEIKKHIDESKVKENGKD